MEDASLQSDDRDLMRRACRGDTSAFGALVRRFQGPVYRLCRRYLGDSEAEDAAQETFLRAFVRSERYQEGRPALPWLLGIARNLCLDRLRGRRRTSASAEGMEMQEPAGVEALASARQELALVQRGLAELPESQREALLLFLVEGLTYRDIAESLEVPMGTVMTWLHRGRAQLKELLAPGANERAEPCERSER